jgi:starvation-inducible DNA-binding protein
MYPSMIPLPEKTREAIAADLNACLADGLDLHSQIKVAHWNVKGPQFAALHTLFESFAVALALHTDAIAERAVALGAIAVGTARHTAKASRIAEYPGDTTRGLDHVGLLAERFETFLKGLRSARTTAEKSGDTDTVDLLTGVVTEFEKHGWFLKATLEG